MTCVRCNATAVGVSLLGQPYCSHLCRSEMFRAELLRHQGIDAPSPIDVAARLRSRAERRHARAKYAYTVE